MKIIVAAATDRASTTDALHYLRSESQQRKLSVHKKTLLKPTWHYGFTFIVFTQLQTLSFH